ncbi:glycine oxidase ThiO [Acidithiobacillus sp. IBUN Pt1247-S3]|uniref:glycine oxidase ThiO n=1 Tax=Acidithiobacillus sp. IBUN Pt1247-S3 TaxID=3166642 RepID=UPI0034E58FAF
MQHADMVVIGAGVIGLSTALRLAQAGMAVTVLERGSAGREASWAGGGILSPLHAWRYRPALLRLAWEGMRRYRDFAEEIHTASHIDPEWQACGMWILDSQEFPLLEDVIEWGASWGWHWQRHTATQMRELAPMLRTDTALFCQEVAQVRNPRLLAGLVKYVSSLGVHIRDNSEVTEIKRDGTYWVAKTGNVGVRADRVLVSGGPWTAKILAQLGIQVPIRPVRGQILLLQGQANSLPQIVLEGTHYLVQRRDGQLLIGSTSEEAGFDKSCTSTAANELLAFAHRVFPPSRSYAVTRQWSGLRPGSPDNIPFITSVPDHPGMYIASGHFRYGLTTAPITAELVRDLVLGRPTSLDLAPYGLPLANKE